MSDDADDGKDHVGVLWTTNAVVAESYVHRELCGQGSYGALKSLRNLCQKSEKFLVSEHSGWDACLASYPGSFPSTARSNFRVQSQE